MKKDFYKNNRGNIAIIVAISLTVLIGILAIVIDGGWLYVSKNKYQNGVEAAAMAGAVSLCDGNPDDSARLIAQENGLPFDESSLEVQIGFYDEKDLYENFSEYKDFVAEGEAGYPEDDFNNAVMVKLNATEDTLMGGFVGKDEVNIGASAVAYLKRYGILELGDTENDEITTYDPFDTELPVFKNMGIMHSNNRINFCEEPTLSGNTIVTACGDIVNCLEGDDGADRIDIRPVDWARLKADAVANGRVITEDDFPPFGNDETYNINGNLYKRSTLMAYKFFFDPFEGNHEGATYYFSQDDFS